MLTVGLISGCEDFLVKDPTFIAKENYFKTAADANTALAGVYDILGREQTFAGQNVSHYTLSDEGFYARTATTGVFVYNFDAANNDIANLWRLLYEGIERANILIERIDQVDMDATEKAAIKGEAKFLRAFYYFSLVSDFGDVPLRIIPTPSVNNVDVPRAPQREVYNFIVTEMEEAESMVKTATQIGFGGRVSKSAVRGLLAKVNLKMAGAPLNDPSRYAEALKWARKIVFPDSGPVEHSLNPNFKQIFTNLASDRYDVRECIWEVECFGNNLGTFEGGRFGNTVGLANNDDAMGFSFGFINANAKLYNSYGATDTRRDWTIASYRYNYNTINGVPKMRDSTFWTGAEIYNRNTGKYRRSYEVVNPRNKNYTPINFPMLRYSDVLLMLAEAETEVNGLTAVGRTALKQVRDRANASDVTTLVSGPEELKLLIKNERFLELAFEGNRKFDLIRWGIFVSTMNQLGSDIQANAPAAFKYASNAGRNITSRNNLFPIPLRETSLNKAATQNPGW
ncbi:RagB/SusD family nutrient uptake outer membrane protein [Pedobacter cryophilus]|uniref:RagB/SusD family nutrient uptake outer membrane protein n=2 Tax=Pedobacter cryophilus TaxID=2571271 RepID=A0A4U1BXK8_9SPHI|nr:RagB/SusD family nutrient uptake outer membrane protein [Pedobacter cryophilus]